MKVLFDLRADKDDAVIEEITSLYQEHLMVVRLDEESITACMGCWNCWLKTPGRCAMNDQMSELYTEYVNSDTVIMLIDTSQGFINHKAKAFLDRTIPHYLPYIEIVEGECHHVARYESYPDMVFYFDNNGITKKEEQVIEDYLYRTACHFQSKASRILKGDNLQILNLEPRNAKNQRVEFASVEPMDKLVVYNGSPRRKDSNSALILKKVAEVLGDKVEVRDLKEKDKYDMWSDEFNNNKNVMFFMPLYVHSMPSHVMEFIEKLQPSKGSISFFVQSGFPESSQSHFLEAYFEQLSLRLERTYLGTAIKGGMEGLQARPVQAQEKMMEPLVHTIVNLVSDGRFKPEDIISLSKPVMLSSSMIFLIKILKKIGLINIIWNQKLKGNNAFEKRFDRPYVPENKERNVV